MSFFITEMQLPPSVPCGLPIPEFMFSCPSPPISQTKPLSLLPFHKTVTLVWIPPPHLIGSSLSPETWFSVLYSFPETWLVRLPAPALCFSFWESPLSFMTLGIYLILCNVNGNWNLQGHIIFLNFTLGCYLTLLLEFYISTCGALTPKTQITVYSLSPYCFCY